MISRISHRKWASWFAAAVLFIIVATHYGIWNDSIDLASLTRESSGSYFDGPQAQAGLEPQQAEINNTTPAAPPPEPLKCPDPEPVVCPTCPALPEIPEAQQKKHMDLPPEYTELTHEDQLCEDFYTEKYIYTIASDPITLLSTPGSEVTQFDVPTHPSQRKLARATPVWLFQGVHWSPGANAFVAQSDAKSERPKPYGMDTMSVVVYDPHAPGCLNTTEKRPLIVYPSMWEGTYPNIWHRLVEIWQAKHSFDAVRIALKDPATAKPFVTPAQLNAANVILPSPAPGPWGDLWKIVTPTDQAAFPPTALDPNVCYDVIHPTVGWASPFWSALLTSTYEYCPRQTLMNRFVRRVMQHFDVKPRSYNDVQRRPGAPTITVVQRGTSRKFRDFDALLEKMHARHPDAPINVVDLSLLSYKDQIQLAQNTDVWVGHHGAGMTYVLFMPRTAAVVEILPPVFVSRGFTWLARMRGLVHFTARAMWQAEYEKKHDGKPIPEGWEPARQEDSDADGWQAEEWVWITHDEILDLVDAAVLSQKERINDLVS